MKRLQFLLFALISIILIVSAGSKVIGQTKETYTGTVLSYGTGMNTRTTTRTFTLTITGITPDEKAKHYLGLLQDGGQDAVLAAIRNEDLGYFSVGGHIARTVNFVRQNTVDGKLRILVAFERWMQGAELRGGYRSIDYPFSVIEIFIDPKTGKGDGTFIAAAQVRWRIDKKTGNEQVEIENFATYPSRLMGVMQRGRKTL